MAVFPSFKLTKKGEELLNRCIGEGKVLTFTKFKIGDGVPSGDWRELQDIANSFKEFLVTSTSVQADQTLRIRGYFDNKGFAEDKKFKEIGVFVSLEGEYGEFLYSYTNTGDTGDIIPAESRGFYSRTLDVANYIGYATNITFNIEQVIDNYDFNTEAELKVATFLKKGDKIRLWGRLSLGDIKTRFGVVTDTETSLAIDNGLFVHLTGNIVVDDIEQLKVLNGVLDGDIITINGYYNADDGATHKRVVASDDDGSGVQLNNGLWANIVHNGEVNVDWLGAKGDGIQIENDYLYKAHSLKNVSLVKYNGNKVYLVKGGEKQIQVNSSIDFCGATLKLEAINSKFEPVFIFNNSSEWKEKNIDRYIRKGQSINSNFNIKPNIFIEVLGEVNGASENKIQLSECFYHINSGCVVGKSFIDRLTGTIRYRDLSKPIAISNAVIYEYYAGNPLDIVEKFHWSWFDIKNYDNVVIKNITTKNNGFVASRECFNIQNGFNIKLDNILFSGNPKLGTQQGVNSAWGYFVNLNKCVNVEFDNFRTPFTTEFTWSSYGMNNCKNIKIKNSTLYRVDQHTLCQDIIVENSTINSSHLSGDGYRIFNNVTFIPYQNDYIFINRGESVTENFNSYDGDIYINNCVIRYPFDTSKIYLFKYIGDKNNTNLLSNSTMHSIFINNLKFEYNNLETEVRRKLSLLNNYGNKEIFYKCSFNNVDFSNIFIENFGLFDETIKANSKHKGSRDEQLYPINSNLYMEFEKCQFNYNLAVGYPEQRGVMIWQNKSYLEQIKDIVPAIKFNDCTNVITSPTCYGIVSITNSTIQSLKFFAGDDLDTKQKAYLYNNRFENCRYEYYQYYTVGNFVIGDSHNIEINKESFTPSEKADEMANNIKTQLQTLQTRYDKKFNLQLVVKILNTPYYTRKMEKEGVLNDFDTYMDEKYEYDKKMEQLERDKQLAYEEELKTNPSLTYEEFLNNYSETDRMMLPEMEEPKPSKKLQEFIDKWL